MMHDAGAVRSTFTWRNVRIDRSVHESYFLNCTCGLKSGTLHFQFVEFTNVFFPLPPQTSSWRIVLGFLCDRSHSSVPPAPPRLSCSAPVRVHDKGPWWTAAVYAETSVSSLLGARAITGAPFVSLLLSSYSLTSLATEEKTTLTLFVCFDTFFGECIALSGERWNSCLYLELTAHKFDLRGAGTFTHYVICMCIITWYLICIFNFLNYHHYQYIATPLETTNHIHLTYPWFNAMSVVGESRVKPNGPGL